MSQNIYKGSIKLNPSKVERTNKDKHKWMKYKMYNKEDWHKEKFILVKL